MYPHPVVAVLVSLGFCLVAVARRWLASSHLHCSLLYWRSVCWQGLALLDAVQCVREELQ